MIILQIIRYIHEKSRICEGFSRRILMASCSVIILNETGYAKHAFLEKHRVRIFLSTTFVCFFSELSQGREVTDSLAFLFYCFQHL
jgi:hypothetical protein